MDTESRAATVVGIAAGVILLPTAATLGFLVLGGTLVVTIALVKL